MVNRQALYNTSNLVTQEVIKKILTATKVSTAVKKKYINQYKGKLSFRMIQNFKLNSENTLKLLTGNRVVKTNLLKNIMNSNMTKNVKLGFVKKTINKNGITKTLNALENMNMIGKVNLTSPVTLTSGNHVLVNNLRINTKGKLMINYALNKAAIKTYKNMEINNHPIHRTLGFLKKLNSAKNIKSTMAYYGANK